MFVRIVAGEPELIAVSKNTAPVRLAVDVEK